MSTKNHSLNIEEILHRVSKIVNSTQNKVIAREFGVKPQTCSNWKSQSRKTIPWVQLLRFSQRRNVSLIYLLTGQNLIKENPGWSFSTAVQANYDFVGNIIAEANEAANNGLSKKALAKIIIEEMKKVIVKLEDLENKSL